MPALAALPVHQGRVLRHPVVPDDNGALLPLDAGLEVGTVGQMVVQELEEGIGLLLLEADDVTSDCNCCQSWQSAERNELQLTLRVNVERLLAGGGVCSDQRVLVDHRVTPLDAAPCGGGVDLLDARVRGLQAMQSLLEEWAEAVVRLHSIDEEGVTSSLGLVKDVKERGARRLLLV